MKNRQYIQYLNSLHNFNAQNENAYAEKNIENAYFKEVMVKVGLCDFIVQRFEQEDPYILILTGHAGDGKTSLMYQVIEQMGQKFDTEKSGSQIQLPNGKGCYCIKDFSEISDRQKKETMEQILQCPQNGKYVFMVANTGPLINTFGEMFEDKRVRENAKLKLINGMSNNYGEIQEIEGYPICVINVAAVDNTYFAKEFLENILKDSLWESCKGCEKASYCHILRNRELMIENKENVFDFIEKHYIWLTEHGKRLTIRSMTEQLAFMITGGMNCADVRQRTSYGYANLFCHLFFGYLGTRELPEAMNMVAIKAAAECGYDKKRLRADERLLIQKEYDQLFGVKVRKLIQEAEKKDCYVKGWTNCLRRIYMFANIVNDVEQKEQDMEDIFSKQYQRYLRLRFSDEKAGKIDSKLVCDALSMIYLGSNEQGKQDIPITMSRESGITQNVQMSIGQIAQRKLAIVKRRTKDSELNQRRDRYELHMKVDKEELECEISLPMLDYFEELKNGIINTNIDPQLSHGVESLKAELAEKLNEKNDSICLVILKNKENEILDLEIDENGYIIE